MKKLGHTFYWGISLFVGGIILLAANLGQFDRWTEPIVLGVIGLSALSGIIFLMGYAGNRDRWWLWLPATTLLALAAVVYLGHNNMLPLNWLLSLLASGVSVGFFVVYLLDNKHWWAVVPGGLLLALAILIGLAAKFGPRDLAGFFFIALGAVAGLVYLARLGRKEAWPAALFTVLFVTLGFLLLSLEGWERGTLTRFWPAALVLLGLMVIVWRVAWALTPEKKGEVEEWQPPASWTTQPASAESKSEPASTPTETTEPSDGTAPAVEEAEPASPEEPQVGTPTSEEKKDQPSQDAG